MKRGKTYIRYSEHFKREVVRHMEETGEGIVSTMRRFGIGGGTTIPRWIKQYGNPKLRTTKIIVMKAEEQDQLKKQSDRIKELEKAIVALQLKHLEAEAFLEVACEELGHDRESFKKKVSQKGLPKQ